MEAFFDGTEVDESILDGGPQIADGTYRVMLTEVVKEDSRHDSRTKMYSCRFSIVEGDFKGHNFQQRFLYAHPTSEIAVQLGKARFKQLCEALCEKSKITTPNDVQNKCCYVTVKNKTSKDGYTNIEIKDVFKKAPPGKEVNLEDLPF